LERRGPRAPRARAPARRRAPEGARGARPRDRARPRRSRAHLPRPRPRGARVARSLNVAPRGRAAPPEREERAERLERPLEVSLREGLRRADRAPDHRDALEAVVEDDAAGEVV